MLGGMDFVTPLMDGIEGTKFEYRFLKRFESSLFLFFSEFVKSLETWLDTNYNLLYITDIFT